MSVIIVSGLLRCGTSLAMAMLEAGGVDVARVGPPFYESHRVRLSVRLAVSDILSELTRDRVLRWWAPSALRALASGARRGRIDPRWFATMDGRAVKVGVPHFVQVPPGPHLALWLDRDEYDRALSMLRHFGFTPHLEVIDFLKRYHEARRPAARAALAQAGARILDIDYEDLIGGPARCRRAVDRIAAFLDRPLDRTAMVERTDQYCRQQNDMDRLRDHFRWWPEGLLKNLQKSDGIA